MHAPSLDRDAAHIKRNARIAGVLYLVLFALAPFVFLMGKPTALVVGDASATAANLAQLGPGLRSSMGIEAVIFLVEVLLTAILYVMFRPVSRTVSFAAALARFGEAAVQGANLLTTGLLVLLLSGSVYAAAFTTAQLEALIHLFLSANHVMVLVWGIFFGFHVLLLSWLVYASAFLPRTLGALLALAAVGYLAQSFGSILWPQHTAWLASFVVILAVPGELAFTFWLLIKGLDATQWRERASEARV